MQGQVVAQCEQELGVRSPPLRESSYFIALPTADVAPDRTQPESLTRSTWKLLSPATLEQKAELIIYRASQCPVQSGKLMCSPLPSAAFNRLDLTRHFTGG